MQAVMLTLGSWRGCTVGAARAAAGSTTVLSAVHEAADSRREVQALPL